MKKTILALILGFMSLFQYIKAQQLPLVAQHPEYHGLLNPASLNIDYLRDERNISFGVSARKQWFDLGDVAPTTQVVRGECINELKGTNLGFVAGGYIVHDKVGVTSNTGAYARFAFVFKRPGTDLTEGGFSVGLNIGFVNYRVRTDLLELNQANDPKFLTRPSASYLDVGIGAYYYHKINGTDGHYFYAGLSMPRTFNFGNSIDVPKRLPHYYALIGYFFPFGNSTNGFLEASLWTRYVELIPPQTSFHLKAQPIPLFWVGAGIIIDASKRPITVLEAGLTIPGNNKSLKIGYSYTVRSSLNYFGDTHEVNIAFLIDNHNPQ